MAHQERWWTPELVARLWCKRSSALSLSLSVSLPPHPCSRCWVYCSTEKHTLFVWLNNNKIVFLDWSHTGWLLRIHTITCFEFGLLLSFIFCRWCMTLLVVLREKDINSGEEWGEIPEPHFWTQKYTFGLFFFLFWLPSVAIAMLRLPPEIFYTWHLSKRRALTDVSNQSVAWPTNAPSSH